MPRVAFLIPFHRLDGALIQSVRSIKMQTISDFEIVMIDDSSANASCDEFQSLIEDDRVKVISNSGSGIVDALNFGIDNIDAEYIARMDSDDICLPNRLEKQLNKFQEDAELGVLGTGTYIVDSYDNFIRYGDYPSSVNGINDRLMTGNFICHPTVMIKKSILIYNELRYSKNFEYCEDYALWLQLSNCCKINNITEPLLIYRQHSQNVSFKKFPEQLLTTMVLQAVYSIPILIENKDKLLLKTPLSIIEHMPADILEKLLDNWRRDVKSMVASGKLNLSEVSETYRQMI